MVEKKSAISYESIMKDLKARKYSPVYVLMGEEPFYIDKICDYISENVLQPEERDFNQTVVFGADVTGAQVADLCKGYPMMAEYRVVVVKEAQNLRNLEALEKYLENPVKTKLLISLPENDRRVTPEIVEREIGVSKDFNAFELRSAIVSRDVFKANQIINYFDSNPKSGSLFTLLPMLFTYFQNLMIAYYAPNRQNENELAKFLDLRGAWAAREYITGMRNYTGVKVMAIIEKFKEVDAKIKGLDNPSTPVGELMKELIFFILH